MNLSNSNCGPCGTNAITVNSQTKMTTCESISIAQKSRHGPDKLEYSICNYYNY